MAEKHEQEEYSPTLYRALPELHGSQSMAIAADVERLLQAVMEMEQVTTDHQKWFSMFKGALQICLIDERSL